VLPADGVLRAAQRWLHLLDRSSLHQASVLIRSRAQYTDLTPTQYATALEWLLTVGLLEAQDGGRLIAPATSGLPEDQASEVLFERSLEELRPTWLADADILVPDATELPEDAAHLAAVLGVPEKAAWLAAQQVHGRIDLTERARIGTAGELALVRLLEQTWPDSTVHIALNNDGFGYDISLSLPLCTWHLEVKTTTRRGRLVVHMSRNEHEVGLLDPLWRMIVVGLDAAEQPAALATVRYEVLLERIPREPHVATRWESLRHQLGPSDLYPGLQFLRPPTAVDKGKLLFCGTEESPSRFAWMPSHER
jgi:hypothetical protein